MRSEEAGRLYCVEGIDGAGKKTQAEKLAAALGGVVFSFPNYDTETGQIILGNLTQKWAATAITYHQDPPSIEGQADDRIRVVSRVFHDDDHVNALVMQALQAVNRYELVGRIETTLNAGRHVVLDRYWPSGFVYGVADGLDRDWLLRIHRSLPQPDVMLLLDVEPAESIQRRPERRDRYEKDANMPVRRALYRQLWQQRQRHALDCGRQRYSRCTCSLDDQSDWRTVDGAGTVDDVHQRIMKYVRP